ncbi:hypothetical protein VB715_13100 [Crocosphaera sp. UHCC 0190]|uniref:hypothetical protein n=1 Tax=Crocosphaera sp. UHCC 0190 TaxID=3110246 RepID=UPI002B20B02C|nr:hypothetical protein [Crocosphaera sp. UHCC 0190]MEA5510704.1 hypothetical protein [Crocosphaera sp. UHCC 0190]
MISHRTRNSFRWFRFLPYLGLGALVFSLNSLTAWNYWIKGYLVLLEAQIGLVIVYWMLAHVKNKN